MTTADRHSYSIRSARTGQAFGTYEGSSPLDALCALHADAGYSVAIDETGTELVFASAEDRDLCGGPEAWDVREVIEPATVECIYCGSSRVRARGEKQPPAEHDDAAWEALAAEHAPTGCEWIDTRANRRDPVRA